MHNIHTVNVLRALRPTLLPYHYARLVGLMSVLLQVALQLLGLAVTDLDWTNSGVICFLQLDRSVTHIFS